MAADAAARAHFKRKLKLQIVELFCKKELEQLSVASGRFRIHAAFAGLIFDVRVVSAPAALLRIG